MKRILLIEPFYTGSHKAWCDDFIKHSSQDVKLISMEGRHWKWRMHGGAITIAKKLENENADILLTSDMIDLALLKALLPSQLKEKPMILYMHENQLTYPWSPDDVDTELKRDRHYGFLNFTSALCADRIFFNSRYHLNSFIEALPEFLKVFPDHRNLETVEMIREKSQVLSLGLDLSKFDQYKNTCVNKIPVVLWNHRWEYDKNPEEFFETLIQLKKEGIRFELVVLGESYNKAPKIFERAKEELSELILHWGYVESFEEYAHWLWRSDILPVTSVQDFFGGSIVEAMYCGCYPLLPDRLAYPEHVEESFLYQPGEFKERLKQVLNVSINFNGSYLSRYDWSNSVMEYDKQLTSFIQPK